MKTTLPVEAEIVRDWILVDAEGKVLGRLAAEIANVLRGKHKPLYTPHVDVGDFVVVINAAKVRLTGKKEEKKIYQRFSGYPSGLKEFTAATVRERHPDRLISLAVKGMLAANATRRRLMKRLKVYGGNTHPHVAQNPRPTELRLKGKGVKRG